MSSEYNSDDDDGDDASCEGHQDGAISVFGDDPSIIPLEFYKRSSASGNSSSINSSSSSSSRKGHGLETAVAIRSNRTNTIPTIAPTEVIRTGRYYPTSGADDVARSAQMILQEVKGHYQHVPVVHQVAVSSNKSTGLHEGELIMGTLNAVASYYELPKSTPVHK